MLAYERLRRERVAQVQQGARQNGLRYDSSYADLGTRDAEIAAHATFRKRLYDYDVVTEANAAAMPRNETGRPLNFSMPTLTLRDRA